MIKIFQKQQIFPNPIKRYKHGKIEVNKWSISQFVLDKLVPIVGIQPFPLDEQQFLVSIVTWYSPDYIFEWGTHVGKSARIFYEIKKNFVLSYKIFSIDLPKNIYHAENPGELRGEYVRRLEDVKLLLGDGVTESIKLANKISGKKRILFFLDGDHSYKSVKKELTTIIRNKPLSAVVVHDTFYQVKESGYNIGPYRAINEIQKKNRSYNISSTSFGLPGMTALLPRDLK